MPDYNIYIRTLGTSGGESSPTQPWSDDGETGGKNPATAINKVSGFIQNPDSIIGSIMRTPIGKIGAAAVLVGAMVAAISITDKAINMYQSYASSASGDYKYQIEYNNFKTQIHNGFHPFSTEIRKQMFNLQIKKENLANEQQRLLLGGTFLNSPYGRYL